MVDRYISAHRIKEAFGLTASESVLVYAVYKAGGSYVTREDLMAELYGDRPFAVKIPRQKIIDVMFCKLRPKLAEFGLQVDRVKGVGTRMTSGNQEALESFLETCARNRKRAA